MFLNTFESSSEIPFIDYVGLKIIDRLIIGQADYQSRYSAFFRLLVTVQNEN